MSPSFLVVALVLSPAPKQKIAILPLAGSQVPPATMRVLDDLVTTAVDRLGRYEVTSASDINALVGLEKMKDAVGCSDVSCAAEIGGALGVELLVSGSVGKLGGELYVTLTLLDTKRSKAQMRTQKRVPDDEKMYARALEDAVGELFAQRVATSSDAPRSVAMTPKRKAAWALTAVAIASAGTGAVLLGVMPTERSVRDNEYARYLAGTTSYAPVQAAVQRQNAMLVAGAVCLGVAVATVTTAIALFASRDSADAAQPSVSVTANGVVF